MAAPTGGGSLVLEAVEVARTDASDGALLIGICKSMDAAADTDDAAARVERGAGQWTPAQMMQGGSRRRRTAAAATRQKAAPLASSSVTSVVRAATAKNSGKAWKDGTVGGGVWWKRRGYPCLAAASRTGASGGAGCGCDGGAGGRVRAVAVARCGEGDGRR